METQVIRVVLDIGKIGFLSLLSGWGQVYKSISRSTGPAIILFLGRKKYIKRSPKLLLKFEFNL